ncbi:MAG: hypothetical protein PHF21_02240 [Bacilli bacterium]|nr:hypothetical protein [Bacilli bacterium]
MKKNYKYVLILITSIFMMNTVSAASYNTPVKSDMSYSECINFQDSVKTSSGNGYFGHCVKATCYSGVWQTQYYISENMVRCTNGNLGKYNQVIKTGCTPYVGSCTPSTTVKYCSIVTYYDCNKTISGGVYTPPTLPSPITTKPTTKPTTKSTTKPKPVKPSPNVPITTEPIKSNNNYIANLLLSPGIIDFNKEIENYILEITEDVTSIEVLPTLEDNNATFSVENNKDISIDKPILITVTAENGDVRVYTINLEYKEAGELLDSNSKINNIIIKNHYINFNSDIFSYIIKINKEDKLDIEVDLSSEKAQYQIIGNDNLKNRSKITITVTAEDGSETPYIINIKKSNNISGVFIVIIVVGIAAFVGFKLIKRITLREKETNYEYE